MSSASDLTVDSLCEVIRFYIRNLAANVGPGFELRIYGVPADDAMKTVMESLGGTLKIIVQELPAEMKSELIPESGREPCGTGGWVDLWRPSKER